MIRPLVMVLAACCLAGPMSASGQTRATTADLAGTVVDQSGAVLSGVTVTAQNVHTNYARSAITDERGHFLIPALPPGTYDVHAWTPRARPADAPSPATVTIGAGGQTVTFTTGKLQPAHDHGGAGLTWQRY